MRLLTLTLDMSLSDLRREIRYTLAKLRARPWAAASVLVFEAQLKAIAQAEFDLAALRDRAEDASAAVDEADQEIDRFVEETVPDVREAVKKDTDAPLYRGLFGNQRPSEFVRPTLGAELEQLRGWPALLKTAPTAELRARTKRCEDLIVAADGALHARGQADDALAVFRASTLVALLNSLNSARAALAGEAEKLRHDGKIPLSAAEGLFRLTTRSRPPRPDTLSTLQDQIRDREAEVAQLRSRLTELQAQQARDEQAEQKRRERDATLAALRAHQAETAAKIAELEKA